MFFLIIILNTAAESQPFQTCQRLKKKKLFYGTYLNSFSCDRAVVPTRWRSYSICEPVEKHYYTTCFFSPFFIKYVNKLLTASEFTYYKQQK